MGGTPVASDVTGRSVDGHEVLDAEAPGELANWLPIASTNEGQLDVDTGISGSSDRLDGKVLALGLDEPTYKHSPHDLAIVSIGRRAGRVVDGRIDDVSLRHRRYGDQGVLNCS
jgi:hypothetical protein